MLKPKPYCWFFAQFLPILFILFLWVKCFPSSFPLKNNLLLENTCYSGKKLVFQVFLSVLVVDSMRCKCRCGSQAQQQSSASQWLMWRLRRMVMHKVALGTFTTQPSIFILQLLVYCPSTNMFSSWLGELSGYASRPALAVEAAFSGWVHTLFFKIFYLTRVNWPVTKHLNTQGRPDPRGELRCFWCPNKTWTLPIGTFGTLKIVKNEKKMTKLWSPKVEGVKD